MLSANRGHLTEMDPMAAITESLIWRREPKRQVISISGLTHVSQEDF